MMIRMIEEHTGILISGRERPDHLKLPPFYDTARLSKLSKIPAPVLNFDHQKNSVQWIPFEEENTP